MTSTTTQPEADVLDLDLIRARARESLYFFAKGILRYDWLVPHIHGPVCRLLEDRTKRRKKFVLPRGWLKSTVCTIAYPIWRGVHDPNVRVLLAQNNRDNARKKLHVIREQFERNALLRALYPEVLPDARTIWSADSLCLNRTESHPEGTFECIGVKGQPTSRHYNVIIEDDTVAPDFDELGEECLAPTHDDVRKAIAWHSLAMPLLTNPSTDEIIVVGTRWYEQDLMSHIATHEPHYSTIERSCREDEDGVSDPRGEVTYPERFSAEVLAEYERSLGPYFYSTLMLNRPVRIGDMVFRAEWFHEYETLPPRQSLDVYTTVDPATDPELASAATRDIDYNVVMTCGKDRYSGKIYVLEYFRDKCSPGDLAAALFDHVIKWRPIIVGYEDVAYQKSLDYWLKELMRSRQQYFVLQPIKRGTRKSKGTHIRGLQPIAASGSFWFRPYMRELLAEFLSFPLGAHDDLIDALAMQTQLWRLTKRANAATANITDGVAFDLTGAIESIKQRKQTSRKGPVFAPSRSASTILYNN